MLTAIIALQLALLVATLAGFFFTFRLRAELINRAVPAIASTATAPSDFGILQQADEAERRDLDASESSRPTDSSEPSAAALDSIQQMGTRVVETTQDATKRLTDDMRLIEGRLERHVGAAAGHLEEVLRSFLDPTVYAQEVDAWLEDRPDDPDDALEYLEAVFTRFPSSPRVFDELVKGYLGIIDSNPTELLVKRDALVRLQTHVGRFSDACSRFDLAHARRIHAQLNERMDALLMDVESRQREGLEAVLMRMEKDIATLRDSGEDDEVLERLAALDEAIDKRVLSKYPDLNDRHRTASRDVVEAMQKIGPSKESCEYDQKTVEAARNAWVFFQDHAEKGLLNDGTNDFNNTDNLDKLVAVLGGWEVQRLLPSTNMYLSSVYSEIFQKLKPDGRLYLTSEMLKAPAKK